MKKLKVAIGSITTLGMLEVFRGLSCFRVRRYKIDVPKKWRPDEPVHIVFLSDLHGKKYGKNNEKLINAVRKESPDLIISGGDMLIRGRENTAIDAAELLKKISVIAPVYCANGNHEQRMRENPREYKDLYQRYRGTLQSYVHFLENDSIDLFIKGMKMTITGLEIPISCYGHFREKPLLMKEITDCVGIAEEDSYQILLAHNPVYMKQYQEWGANLTLAGHLHGGIVRIPGIGGVITPQVQLFPKYSGDMYHEGDHYGIVSRGLGTHTVNIRLFNMAELVSVSLE